MIGAVAIVAFAVLMAAAAMLTAVMMVAVLMVRAGRGGVEGQPAGNQRIDRLIRRALNAAINLNAGLCERDARAAADAAADQRVDTVRLQKARQRAMAAAIGRHNLAGNDLVTLYRVNFKLFGVPEMLENLSVVICGCNFHKIRSAFQIKLNQTSRHGFSAL